MKKLITFTALLFLIALSTGHAQTPGFTGKPIYQIVTKRAGVYLGTIKVELFPNIAWHHARNFDSLVSVQFYDTTAFHRVVPGFVIQGGDPNSRHGAMSTWGYGQPNQPTVDAEFSAAKHLRGRLSAARSANINSATSQFFICVATAANLDYHYSLYGQVTSGMNIVDTIVNSPCYATTYTQTPLHKIEMFVTRIGSNDSVPNTPVQLQPVNGAVNTNTNLVQVKWNYVGGGIIYHVEVARDSLFQDTVATHDVAINYYNVTGLDTNTVYYWHVNVNNGGHFSAYSPTWTFRTKSPNLIITGLDQNSAGNTALRVFPNPSSGKFSFENVERGSKLQIFDSSGRLVSEAIAGEGPLSVDLTKKEKGEYFYKLSDNAGGLQSGKLIVQ